MKKIPYTFCFFILAYTALAQNSPLILPSYDIPRPPESKHEFIYRLADDGDTSLQSQAVILDRSNWQRELFDEDGNWLGIERYRLEGNHLYLTRNNHEYAKWTLDSLNRPLKYLERNEGSWISKQDWVYGEHGLVRFSMRTTEVVKEHLYQYDSLERLSEVGIFRNGKLHQRIELAYNPQSQLIFEYMLSAEDDTLIRVNHIYQLDKRVQSRYQSVAENYQIEYSHQTDKEYRIHWLQYDRLNNLISERVENFQEGTMKSLIHLDLALGKRSGWYQEGQEIEGGDIIVLGQP